MSDKYIEIFIQETRENLDNINEGLLALENHPDDRQIIDEIFRAAHTLKGMAGSMQFKEMNKLTHSMENVLDNIRNGKNKVDDNLMDLLFDCLDSLENHLDSIINTNKELKNDKKLMDKLKEILDSEISNDNNLEYTDLELDDYQVSVIKKALDQGLDCYKLRIVIDKDCKLKAARAYMIFKNLESYGQIIKTVPITQKIEEGQYDQDLYIWLIMENNLTSEQIKKQIENISEVEKVEVDKIFESSLNSRDEIKDKHQSKNKDNINENKNNKNKIINTIRVDINKLDSIMNQVSELIIIKNRMQELSSRNENISDAIERLGRLTGTMHDSIMKLRMVPLNTVFNRFPRTIRDLSKKTGKKIQFKIKGADTEVDKTIADSLSEPLIHILRNSVDHGIEPPHERIKYGKDQTGKIQIDAFYEGNDVVIQIEDDGKGIQLDAVFKKAVQRGLVQQSDVHNLSKHQIIEMLFMPGFSTSDKISDISGRGVGLDVVKSKIEALGGNIEIESEQNNGTCFIMRLPLTLAIMQALIIGISNQKFAIPLSSVKEVISIKRSDVKSINGTDFFSLRDKLIPLKYIDKLLDIKDIEYENELVVLIIKKNKKLFGLTITDSFQEQEIVVKSIGKYLSKLKIFSGATILENGKPALILDTNYLC